MQLIPRLAAFLFCAQTKLWILLHVNFFDLFQDAESKAQFVVKTLANKRAADNAAERDNKNASNTHALIVHPLSQETIHAPLTSWQQTAQSLDQPAARIDIYI